MDGAEEIQVLKEIAETEKLPHPTDEDEQTIDKKPPGGPPSLFDFESYPDSFSYALPVMIQVLPYVMKSLSFEEVLRCRLLCHGICDTIDQQLESNLEISPYLCSSKSKLPQPSLFINCRIHTSPTGPHILEGINLLDTETVTEFLQKMQNHTRNPFIARCVRFGNYGDTIHNSQYWDHVLELLKNFGHHIWHVELSDGHVTIEDPLNCYKLIRKCLILMPHLKSLEISFANEPTTITTSLALIQHVMENPLPPLKYLEKLDWNDHKVSETLQGFVISAYCHQLKALAVPVNVLYVENKELSFPKLEALYVTTVENNEHLVDLRWVKLPRLRTLYLNLGGERCTSCGDLSSEIWNVKSILALVEQFQLNFLSLFLSPGTSIKSRTLKVEKWKLDCLKTLEIQHCQDTSYEFLRCFPKLQHIHFFDIHHPMFPERQASVQNSKMGEYKAEANLAAEEVAEVEASSSSSSSKKNDYVEINEYLYKAKMYDSNMWEIIPNLQIITFKCVWDRQGENLIAVNDWYWKYFQEHLKKEGTIAVRGVVSKMVGFIRSMFSFS